MSCTRLAVHVTPKSGRDEVAGWRGAELQIKVTAPPEDGKANAAVCKLVAGLLGISKSSVRVLRGETSRHKVLEVDVGEDVVTQRFGEPEPGLF